MSWLATGAGASEGLEQMLARMREEDSLRQHQQQIDESGRANRADEGYRDRALSEQSALREATLANTAEMQRGVNADRDEARANVLGDAIATDTPPRTSIGPQTSNILKMSGRSDLVQENEPYAFPPSSILPLRSSTVRDVIPGEQEGAVFKGTASQLTTERAAKATEEERLRNNTRQETDDRRADEQLRISRGHLGVAQDNAATSKKDWAEPTVNIQDTESGISIPVPRSIAADPTKAAQFVRDFRAQGIGSRSSPENQKVNAYKDTLADVDALKQALTGPNGAIDVGKLGRAIGPVDKLTGKLYESTGAEVLGGGGKLEGAGLRSRIEKLKARASFAEGGKAFTATEKELMDSFLAQVYQQPEIALQRLEQFAEQARRSLGALGASGTPAGSPATSTSPTSPTAATAPAARKVSRKVGRFEIIEEP